MDTKGLPAQRSDTPPIGAEASAPAHSSDLPPSSAEVFSRTCQKMAMQDVENLPASLARAEASVIEGLEITEREIRAASTLERSDSFSSVSSTESFESDMSDTSSVSSFSSTCSTSSDGSEIEPETVPSGQELLRLPGRPDFIESSQRYNLLANLIMGQISEDEKLAIPAEILNQFCLQAMAELQYLVQLGGKVEENIKLLKLPKIAVDAIKSKFEKTQEPYTALKEDVDNCLKQFKAGQYKTTRRFIEPLSMDDPEGPSRLVTATTHYVDKLICAWIYVLRNQEEWRKAMPAPSEIIRATLPDAMAGNPKTDSAAQLTRQLVEHSQQMMKHWEQLGNKVGASSQILSTYQKVKRPAASAPPVKKLPELIPTPYGDTPHCATLTIEKFQLPVFFDLGKSVTIKDSEKYSARLLPNKKVYEFSTTENFDSKDQALQALNDAENYARKNPDLYGVNRESSDGVDRFLEPVDARPAIYFNYQPVAIHSLKELVTVGTKNALKVHAPADVLAHDRFKNDRMNKTQREDWRGMRKQLAEDSCKLWSLRIPSLQEAIDVCCQEKHKQEVERLRKQAKRQRKSLKHQLSQGLTLVRKVLTPRSTPVPTPGVSPVPSPTPKRRVMHTQSNPELLSPGRSRPALPLLHSDLVLKLEAAKRRQETKQQDESQTALPEIVIDPVLSDSWLSVPGILLSGSGKGTLSPISSDPGSASPEELPTPKAGSGSSPDTSPGELARSDDIETPMVETKADPFSPDFPRHREDENKTTKQKIN